MSFQGTRSAKESGHSLEFNGPLQKREHSLLVIRKRRKALDRLCSKQKFHSLLLHDNMHMRYPEKAWSYCLEFCAGGLYKPQGCLLGQLLFFPLARVVSVSCVCLVLYVISLVISNIWRPMWGLSETESVSNLGGILNP